MAAAPTPAELRDAALSGDELAWDIVEGLTTEIGPRLAGTEAERRARDWAVVRLRGLGFANVRIEPFAMPVWTRGAEMAEIVSPFPQRLAITALGNSATTTAAGLSAQVVAFQDIAALEAAPDSTVAGKIVYLSHRMGRTQDGSGYGAAGPVRRTGPSIAAKKGAAAIVIRSLGTDRHRNPHAGGQRWAEGAKPIPAGALSLPDAEQLDRVLARGKPVTLKLVLISRTDGQGQSGNVIAEIPGSDPNAGIVLAGCHLDSWDLGTGAIDDAAGCAIVTAAAKRVLDTNVKPRRTIRVVWFGAEEVGLFGGIAYRDAHAAEKHIMLAESDFGADRIWRIDSKVVPSALPLVTRIADALAPLGVAPGRTDAQGGSDIGPLAETGVPVIDLLQDGTRYFDLHHTANDTLDKIDPEQLRQNVAAWTAMLAIVSTDDQPLGPVPPDAAH